MSGELEDTLHAQYDGGYDTSRETERLRSAIVRLEADRLEERRLHRTIDAVDLEGRQYHPPLTIQAPTAARASTIASSWDDKFPARYRLILTAAAAVLVVIGGLLGWLSNTSYVTGQAASWVTPTPVILSTPRAEQLSYTLSFIPGQATLSKTAKATLDSLVTTIEESPGTVIISGHAAEPGSEAANTQLALQRAQAVAAFLEARGVPQGALLVEGTVGHDVAEPNYEAYHPAARAVTITLPG
jgi:outer membrane protein OmpA-like peptidoglycan-associated protein